MARRTPRPRPVGAATASTLFPQVCRWHPLPLSHGSSNPSAAKRIRLLAAGLGGSAEACCCWPRWPGCCQAILVATGMSNAAVRGATADLKGEVSVGSLSLGWLSPVPRLRRHAQGRAGQPRRSARRTRNREVAVGTALQRRQAWEDHAAGAQARHRAPPRRQQLGRCAAAAARDEAGRAHGRRSHARGGRRRSDDPRQRHQPLLAGDRARGHGGRAGRSCSAPHGERRRRFARGRRSQADWRSTPRSCARPPQAGFRCRRPPAWKS